MPQRQISCPQCGQPAIAQIDQLIDIGQEPELKNALLNGQTNVAICQSCGYQGNVPTPIVYHDPGKELLLTYFPPEMNVPLNQQEQIIGPMIRKVVDNLKPEQRKGYLFKPQTMLSYKRLIEVILEADGITPEMMKAQQDRLSLLQRLIPMAEDSRKHVLEQEEAIVDEEFFQLLNTLVQMTASQGDRQNAQVLVELQKFLFENTVKGKELKAQLDEAQAAISSLQEASKDGGLTQEKLVDLIVNASSDIQLVTLVNYAFQGLDYTFFSLLAQRIEKAQGEDKEELMKRRDRVLEMRQEIEKEIAEQTEAIRGHINHIISADNMEQAMGEHAQMINQGFVEILQTEIELAQQKLDMSRAEKLQQLFDMIMEASQPPAEIAFAQLLLETEDEAELDRLLKENDDMVDDKLSQALGMLVQQTESRDDIDQATKEHLEKVFGKVLKVTMKKNMAK
ncbi:MAG: CpXC domain-containing protein [Anaerolineae bacterium]|jgi:hypothetical protein|nr:CpXC domain-containing protein [Anaerolineae bacterium]